MTLIDPDYQPPKPPTGASVILKMRDDFIQLAQCYLAMREYDGALHATDMAQRLEKFENEHIQTNMEWPARLIDSEFTESGKELAEVEP